MTLMSAIMTRLGCWQDTRQTHQTGTPDKQTGQTHRKDTEQTLRKIINSIIPCNRGETSEQESDVDGRLFDL